MPRIRFTSCGSVAIQTEIGKVICLLDPDGVGKTSLLRPVVGGHPTARGTIRWDGKDIIRLPTFERARLGIGYVPPGRDIFLLLTVVWSRFSGAAAPSE